MPCCFISRHKRWHSVCYIPAGISVSGHVTTNAARQQSFLLGGVFRCAWYPIGTRHPLDHCLRSRRDNSLLLSLPTGSPLTEHIGGPTHSASINRSINSSFNGNCTDRRLLIYVGRAGWFQGGRLGSSAHYAPVGGPTSIQPRFNGTRWATWRLNQVGRSHSPNNADAAGRGSSASPCPSRRRPTYSALATTPALGRWIKSAARV